MKVLFVVIIFIWLFVGFLGMLRMNKNDRPNYEFGIYMFFSPFIPVVAKFCGLL